MAEPVLVHDGLSDLRESLAGSVVAPDDATQRRCFNAVDRRPPQSCAVPGRRTSKALDFARAHELEVAVRGGGHNPAGHCVLDGGIVIDLSAAAPRRGRRGSGRLAGGGSTWLDFDSATLGHGLVTPGGVVGSTGVCGLAMGGGIGHLTSQFGLTCDNVVGAELVTPDGSVVRELGRERRASVGSARRRRQLRRRDVVEFRLHELPRVVGGLLVYDADGVRDGLRLFRDLVAGSRKT